MAAELRVIPKAGLQAIAATPEPVKEAIPTGKRKSEQAGRRTPLSPRRLTVARGASRPHQSSCAIRGRHTPQTARV